MSKLKVMTVVGTRPEIIRLAATIRRLDIHMDHVLVHTGQNYDYELNQVFFSDLGLREPDHYLAAETSSLGAMLGSILAKVESVLLEERPDAMLVLGDTNSCISALMAKRMRIPVFHMEAGNRSFDENVPEETNRRMIDHVSDYNLVYTEHARRNLLSEGIHPSRIIVTGSPMLEVLNGNRKAIESSNILDELDLESQGYFLVSLHREETVDDPERLSLALQSIIAVSEHFNIPVLVSTHPRLRKRLETKPEYAAKNLHFHKPFGFNDYVHLQSKAKLVLSDSGTISEESSLLGFPAVTLRDFIERPEALDTASILTTGLIPSDVLDAVQMTLEQFHAEGPAAAPVDYLIDNASRRAVNFIRSAAHAHALRTGIRRR